MDVNERRARASADAAEWWEQLRMGSMSRDQREQFVIWLRESALHVTEIMRMAQLYNALQQFDGWDLIGAADRSDDKILDFPHAHADSSAAFTQAAEPTTPSLGHERKRRRLVWGGALAASLVAVAAAFLLPQLLGQTIQTERGERREVALGDGSVLQVDPETKLRVRLAETRRDIVLEHGRALFHVAKDPGRPFTVRADDTLVRAVGTAFAVERKNLGVTVTVAEGRVAVSSSPAASGNRQPNADNSPPVLQANEQITVKPSGTRHSIRTVDTSRELAWAEGRLIFDKATMVEAAAQFNRYNRVQLRVADGTLAELPISGVFDAADPYSFIAFVQTVTHVRVDRRNGQDITITSAP